MKTKTTLLELLRKQPEMYLRDLPENIRIPALDGNRPDGVPSDPSPSGRSARPVRNGPQAWRARYDHRC